METYQMYEQPNDKFETQSITEKILLAELYNLGLRPEPQYLISLMHVDFAFPREKLVVEVEGPHHDKPAVMRSDKKRYSQLRQRGWKVRSYNAEEIYNQPKLVANKIKEELDIINNVDIPYNELIQNDPIQHEQTYPTNTPEIKETKQNNKRMYLGGFVSLSYLIAAIFGLGWIIFILIGIARIFNPLVALVLALIISVYIKRRIIT